MLLRISSRQEVLRGKSGYVFILCIEEDLPKDVVWGLGLQGVFGTKYSVLSVEKTGLFFLAGLFAGWYGMVNIVSSCYWTFGAYPHFSFSFSNKLSIFVNYIRIFISCFFSFSTNC